MKVGNLHDAVKLIKAGSTVGFGGNTMHRVPMAAVQEMVRQQIPVKIVKSAGSLEVDALCAAGLAEEVHAAYVGYENFGMARFFRQAVEQGITLLQEHT